ncbi:MAG: hypothetical protein WC708_16995 [Lentisphaeria bacterium]
MKKTVQNSQIQLSFDLKTGFINEITDINDEYKSNWVLSNSQWGRVQGFDVESVSDDEKGITVFAAGTALDSDGLSLKIKREMTANGYIESYTFKNKTDAEFFVTQETFGIYFSFNSIMEGLSKNLNHVSNAHVWCGDRVCWICGKKINGQDNKLIINMTNGLISDYSISRDVSRTLIAADYRGDIVLNPTPCIIDHNGELTISFEYFFTTLEEEKALAERDNFINVYANTYTEFIGNTIHCFIEYNGKINDIKVICNKKEVEIKNREQLITWDVKSDNWGEITIDVYVNDKHTYIKLNFIEPLDKILESRAYFIAKNQQFLKEGSHLDGAYLIYDKVEDRQHFSDQFRDYNGGRERIVMGIIILKQLQKKHDDFLMQSIERHRLFVEREHFDTQTGVTYNQICRNNKEANRIFNYPWFSLYFKEWYVLTGEKKYIEMAAHALRQYYKITKYIEGGQNVEAYDIIKHLKKEGLLDLADLLKEDLIKNAENIIKCGISSATFECSYVNEWPNERLVYLSQAYLLTKDKRFLDATTVHKKSAESFYTHQPDFHMNSIALRHWDRFWFGKKRQFGDLYPHYWSALMGWMYWWYQKASGEDYSKTIEEILKNNLCIYRTDGFAANNYLYPYKIDAYSLVPNFNDPFRSTGSYYGKEYDEWANDQDWSLYIALCCIK